MWLVRHLTKRRSHSMAYIYWFGAATWIAGYMAGKNGGWWP